MSGYPSNSQLAEQVAEFASEHAPAQARWEYAVVAGSHMTADGRRYNLRGMPSLSRFLGYNNPSTLPSRLSALVERGFEGERRRLQAISAYWREHDPLRVSAIEPWQIGHVYFTRLKAFPHVGKIGFSRRVRDRIEDIESKSGRLIVEAVRVGTLADEHWWHHNWRSMHIAGEWFYWPQSNDRSLPPFLQQLQAAA